MNRISQQHLLRTVFVKVLDREFQVGPLDDRIILQKIVFLCMKWVFHVEIIDLYGICMDHSLLHLVMI